MGHEYYMIVIKETIEAGYHKDIRLVQNTAQSNTDPEELQDQRPCAS